MQRPYNDRWERTRRHLLRNLFDYHGDLSPIAEESGSDSSDGRPYSPLPDLIVEREPNRHDHSEEFYEALAVRMRRYYTRLFIDGVREYEATLNDVDDIPEFEVNKSMASTFIIDANHHEDEARHMVEADEIREESYSVIDEDEIEVSNIVKNQSTFQLNEEKSDARNVTDDYEKQNGIESPHVNNTELDVGANEAEYELNDAVNKSQATPDKDASKSIETASDLVQSYHRTSTTVAQVHSEVHQVRTPRVFEDGSPVLMPKAHELSRSVFGKMCLKVRNIMSFANDDENDEEHQEKGEAEEFEGNDQNTQQDSKKIEDINESKTLAENSDLEVERLIKSVECVSNESHELIETCEEEETFEDIEQNETHESTSKANEDDNESPLRTSESDEITHVQNEETIGPNEFVGVELTPESTQLEINEEEIFEPDENSFEMALRKGLFETKNARKNPISSSDVESEDSSEVFEPVEAMRGTRQTRLTENMRRESTLSQDSPLDRTAIKATAEEIEEDHFEPDGCQSNASEVVIETRDDREDQSLQMIDLSTSQDSYSTDANGTDDAEEENFADDLECVVNASVDKENESSDDADTNTPSGAKIRSIADVCDDLWSVSPVSINFEELPPKDVLTSSCSTDSNQKKRASDLDSDGNAPMNKKKRYNNIAIQAGAPKESTADWYNVKNNFFVGKPLVFKLCSCHDHVCL